MSDVLLTLADGDVTNFKDDSYFGHGGCETCDYGSSYVQYFTIETTKGSLTMKIDNMYEYAVSHDFLFKTILPNVEKIKGMIIAEFFDWFEAAVRKLFDDAKSVKFTRTKC